MKKKVLIIAGAVLSAFFLTWAVFIFLFPISIIEGEAYNTNKLKNLNKQRESVYNELYISLHDELNKIINKLYFKPTNSEYTNNNEIEKYIINNGDISLLDSINEYSLLYLTKEELRILRNTFFAKYGYTFRSQDLSEHFGKFAWYESRYANVDEKLSKYDNYIIEIIQKVENKQINTDLQSVLEIFYAKSISTDEDYFQLINECKSDISFPLQNKKQHALNEVFPACVNVIEYNDQIYDQFALNLFLEQYRNIIGRIIEAKTNDFMEYIDFYSKYPEIEFLPMNDFAEYRYEYETMAESVFDYYINQCLISNKIIDKTNYSNANVPDDYFFSIPVVTIDDDYYSLVAINELQKSMRSISSYLIKNTKNILIEGVNYQTTIYSDNIEHYVDWYYSYLTSIDKTIENIIGFFTGEKSVKERYYNDNFNRIMDTDANFYEIIEDNIYNIFDVIDNLFDEYLELKKHFSFNIHQATAGIMTVDDYAEPYVKDIVAYFDNVFEAMDNVDNYYLQEYTKSDNEAVKKAKTSIKLLSGVNFFGGILIDYLSLKAQELLNRNELSQQIYNSMMQNQRNKIAIINDPFNYLFDKLSVGSVIFVDNYFVGLNAYQHYGVYIGNGKVIHFAAPEGKDISPENGIIHETTLAKFLNGRSLQIDMNIKTVFSENEIIRRARSRMGEQGYDLLTNNCEHFARWCVTGENVSHQIDNLPQKLDSTLLVIEENLDMISKFIALFN